MRDEELLKYNRQGFIPGPLEDEMKFLERISYCQNLEADIEETPVLFTPSKEFDKELYRKTGFTLDWVPVIYSNKDLALWHGGCAWIFQKESGNVKGAFFQLRRPFSMKEKVFGYTKEEILMHESVHVARMEFEEPQFEEFLAYRTSKSRLRRYLGPIISKSHEVIFFFLALLLPFLLFPFLPPNLDFFPFWIPFLVTLYGFLRLILRHAKLHRCLIKISAAMGSNEKANHVLYRLTDNEIKKFGKLPLDKLKAFIYSDRTETLRQRVLYTMFTNCEVE